MHAKYAETGLSILAFPCNQFANQEPGTHEQIKQYAKSYSAQFDMFSKIKVNGPQAHPLWKWLKSQPNGQGILGNSIKWNFTKGKILKVLHGNAEERSRSCSHTRIVSLCARVANGYNPVDCRTAGQRH
ncbi:Phospholipid hydroperoxide glutathione peroxidase, mitochondrial [Bagarius yarrelli]|uniref:Glutathione peroxidase n=1 Tax=Bagarius yarrelli TaxID=175774 RepID=A0A556TS77_BAGYA|nr:Phospholipid hydroperoxide glutathione peroxidase, mitochondrial [Bagarius yarrelli]